MKLQFDTTEETFSTVESQAAKRVQALRNNNLIAFTPKLLQAIMPYIDAAKFCCLATLHCHDNHVLYTFPRCALSSIGFKRVDFCSSTEAHLITERSEFHMHWVNHADEGMTVITELPIPDVAKSINLSKSNCC